jgi:hypothetical protein
MVKEILRMGGCRCGDIRFEARGKPKFVGNCHCEDCRRSTGAAFSTYVGYLDDDVRWAGASPVIFESSSGVKRGFCGKCGTPVSYRGYKWSGETHLFIGEFDDPSDLVPAGDVFSKEALPWCEVRNPRN